MRYATKKRTTKETDIQVSIQLDGSGQADIHTGIGFFDHMLTLLSFHSQMDLTLFAQGDLEVCDHHCVEAVSYTHLSEFSRCGNGFGRNSLASSYEGVGATDYPRYRIWCLDCIYHVL